MIDKRHKYVRLLPLYSIKDNPAVADNHLVDRVGKIIGHRKYIRRSCGVVDVPGIGKLIYPLADMESITKKEYFIGALGG